MSAAYVCFALWFVCLVALICVLGGNSTTIPGPGESDENDK